MKRIFILCFFFFMSGCYFWASNVEIRGIVISEENLKYENVVTIKGNNGEEYVVRFQLAVEGKSGYDPEVLAQLHLLGKECIIKTGPHGVVINAIIVLDSGLYEIPKIKK